MSLVKFLEKFWQVSSSKMQDYATNGFFKKNNNKEFGNYWENSGTVIKKLQTNEKSLAFGN